MQGVPKETRRRCVSRGVGEFDAREPILEWGGARLRAHTLPHSLAHTLQDGGWRVEGGGWRVEGVPKPITSVGRNPPPPSAVPSKPTPASEVQNSVLEPETFWSPAATGMPPVPEREVEL